IEKISDLLPGMILEGTVTNVAAFGAFVDVGVHQDGLVHVSALANRFVSDPREVVKSGQVVRVKVLEADPERKRISLTLRLDDEPSGGGSGSGRRGAGGPDAGKPRKADRGTSDRGTPDRGTDQRNAGSRTGAVRRQAPAPQAVNTAMAEALRKAGLGK
ncbi:MAG: S1 RNA-binding domain-containing protein, partial [Pseudarthrobacter sp.]|nr:S1 RNA-binding domain-containing protein [Pseudarthrobacter sp.]